MKDYVNDYTPRKIRKLTVEQIKESRSLRESGKSFKEIAIVMQCSIKTIYDACKMILTPGWDRKNGECYKEQEARAKKVRIAFINGMTRKELAIEFNLSRAWITQILNNSKFTDENYKKPQNGLFDNSNFTIEEIISMRKRYDDGEDVWSITDDFRNRIKCNPTGTIRKICKREMFKNI